MWQYCQTRSPHKIVILSFYGITTPNIAPAPVAWYRKAAERGYGPAQMQLGWAYRTGKIVPRDFAQAEAWFRKAADQGDEDAKKVLAERATWK